MKENGLRKLTEEWHAHAEKARDVQRKLQHAKDNKGASNNREMLLGVYSNTGLGTNADSAT